MWLSISDITEAQFDALQAAQPVPPPPVRPHSAATASTSACAPFTTLLPCVGDIHITDPAAYQAHVPSALATMSNPMRPPLSDRKFARLFAGGESHEKCSLLTRNTIMGTAGSALARWLRGFWGTIEAYVIHPTSVGVPREHRRAKTDRSPLFSNPIR